MRHLPNLITLVRILLTPYIGWALARHDWSGVFPFLFFAGSSDWLDGYLARRFAWGSALGAKLDPIADKLLVATVYLGLGFGGMVPWWLVGLVFGRDLAILAAAGLALALTTVRQFPPSEWGKRSTFCQLMLAGGAVMNGAWPWVMPHVVVEGCIWIVAVMTVVSRSGLCPHSLATTAEAVKSAIDPAAGSVYAGIVGQA